MEYWYEYIDLTQISLYSHTYHVDEIHIISTENSAIYLVLIVCISNEQNWCSSIDR